LGMRQTSSLQADLDKLRAGDSSIALQGQIAASLAALNRTADNLDTMAKRESGQVKQEKAHMRVQKFRGDYAEFKAQFDQMKAQAANEVAAAHRTELFQQSSGSAMSPADARRRVTAARAETSESPFNNPAALPGASYRQAQALDEHSWAENTETQLDMFLAQGREVIDNLVDQKNILKGTQRRLLDSAQTLGLSRDVIGWIERRSKQDTILFCIGAIFTFFCFYWIWRWFG